MEPSSVKSAVLINFFTSLFAGVIIWLLSIFWPDIPKVYLFAGFLIILLAVFLPVIPKAYRKYLLHRFWGKEVLGQRFVITYGGLMDSRLAGPNPPTYRYVKKYHDGRAIPFVGPWFLVIAESEIRGASYLINALGKYRKEPISVENDAAAYGDLDRSFVALGSPSSNEISDLIQREPNNEFLEFRQESSEGFIFDKKGGRKFVGFKEPARKDYGMVLRLPNLRFPGHFFFVCAGLGEWGTSGAAWYLATKWRDLLREFGNSPFGIAVEVEIGVDNSTVRVFPE